MQETALQLLANDTQREEHKATIAQLGELGVAPSVFYDSLEQALNHRNSLEGLRKDLAARQSETDPYGEQITDMQGQALQEVSYDTINELTRLQEHQDFLLKLLTSKDSFVRKKIIDQNLAYLNQRLTHYLDRIGLPHTVKFQNDLSYKEISDITGLTVTNVGFLLHVGLKKLRTLLREAPLDAIPVRLRTAL